VQLADTPSPQSATLGLYPVAVATTCALQELIQLIHWGDRQEVLSEDQGAQERSGFIHSWYTDRPTENSVTHKSAITDHAVEGNHVIDWDKASGRQRGTDG